MRWVRWVVGLRCQYAERWRLLQGGAALYAARIPERWKPGAFDLFFNSHQIFHCAVVIAALLHYWGVRILLHWRDTTGGCSLPFEALIANQIPNNTKS
jgi:hypothetical protein